MKTSNPEVIETKKRQGFRVYELEGLEEKVIARKGGPSYQQVKNSPSYQDLRKNQREFGVASMMAKEVRQSLPVLLSEICESYTSGKLTARFRKLAQKVKGVIGSRPLLVSEQGQVLKGFEFNSRYPFRKVFQATFLLKPSSTRGHFIFHFPSYVPELKINSPKGSTHYKLFSHLIALSDFECEAPGNQYKAVDPESLGRSTTLKIDMQPLCRIPLDPMTTHISISNGKEISRKSGLILLMGIQFYRYESARYDKVKNGNAMQIYEVF